MAKPRNSKRLKVTLDGQSYVVEIREIGATELQVTVNGQVHHLTVDDVLDRSAVAKPVYPTTRNAPVAPTPAPSQSFAMEILSAPMPGDITEILVSVGDRVEAGQGVCVLEAMKMKNILRASRNARVAEILVSVGQTVDYGARLVRFD
jgi:biotin carboxyl carrier protein